jgi:hypothetical protein
MTTHPDCPQCGETSCDCTPMCLDRMVRFTESGDYDTLDYICELPPDHDGRHKDGSVSWSDGDGE